MRRRHVLACAAASVIIVAGCGSGSGGGTSAATSGTSAAASGAPTSRASATTVEKESPTASGSTPQVDPCALLSDEDVNAGFALSDLNSQIEKVTRTPNQITADSSSCTFDWVAANDSSSSFALYVYPASVYEGLKGAGASETVPEIPGAYRTPDGYFIAAGPLTLSITGVEGAAAVGKLLHEAAAKSGH
jgi:hypothetical protein